MTKEIAKTQGQTIYALLQRAKPQMSAALPKHMTADRLVRIAWTSIQQNPKLLDCTEASLVRSIIQSCQLGLEPDGITGQAYLVPYGNTCQLIPGYRGLIDLARRSGLVSSLYANVVYEGEDYTIEQGERRLLTHKPSPPSVRGKGIVGAYAVVHYKDGTSDWEWMWAEEIEEVRSKSPGRNSTPWTQHTTEMYKKTVIRRLAKRLPLSPEFRYAAQQDEGHDALTDGGIGAEDVIPTSVERVEYTPAKVKEAATSDEELNKLLSDAKITPKAAADIFNRFDGDIEAIKAELRPKNDEPEIKF